MRLLFIFVAGVLASAYAPAGFAACKEQMAADKQLERFDKEGKGYATFEDYMGLYKGYSENSVKPIFEKKDFDKDGKITLQEVGMSIDIYYTNCGELSYD